MMGDTELRSWLRRISRLALIHIDESEEEDLLKDLVKIIEFFNKLQEVNVDNVEPLFMTPREKPIVREDEVKPGLDRKEFLINVKEHVEGYVKGPKTV